MAASLASEEGDQGSVDQATDDRRQEHEPHAGNQWICRVRSGAVVAMAAKQQGEAVDQVAKADGSQTGDQAHQAAEHKQAGRRAV